MGHWSEDLVEQVAARVGGRLDYGVIRRILRVAGHEIEALSGRTFHSPRESTSEFEPNGMPFVDVSGMHVGTVESARAVWPVPDPVSPQFANVLQLLPLDTPRINAASTAVGLGYAGQLVAHTFRDGRLSREFVLHWLGNFADPRRRNDLFHRLMDPSARFYVPIFSAEVEGWWIQISRRLIWITPDTEDEGRLFEPLIGRQVDGYPPGLAATEPIMIAIPMTCQPVGWAFTARIWPEIRRPVTGIWNKLAQAIHGHGIPTITIDRSSTPQEIACQVVLKAYWHRYIGGGEPGLANIITLAYPKQVDFIRRKTGAQDQAAAAAMLFEQLIQPGFDPAQGAEATRRYVRRKASIIVMEHRKQESPERYPWTQIGISERRYYKLLPLFAEKVDGRYDVDYNEIVARMKAYLNDKDHGREVRAAALALLQDRGFSAAAARKWLQRHPPEQALDAWPRGTRPSPPNKASHH